MKAIDKPQDPETTKYIKENTKWEDPNDEEWALMEDITDIMTSMKWGVKKRKGDNSRKNVFSDGVDKIEAVILGRVKHYYKKHPTNEGGLYDAAANRKYPELHEKLNALMKLHNPDFTYNSIQLNKNVITNKHFDRGNVGMSYCLGLGDYDEGGIDGLVGTEWVHYDNNYRWLKYNGNRQLHRTHPHTRGTRFAAIFFTHKH
tara:strand:- start:8264 stop:8869 length:606 start_codon:yes stop_codon:yes gene_type:complete